MSHIESTLTRVRVPENDEGKVLLKRIEGFMSHYGAPKIERQKDRRNFTDFPATAAEVKSVLASMFQEETQPVAFRHTIAQQTVAAPVPNQVSTIFVVMPPLFGG